MNASPYVPASGSSSSEQVRLDELEPARDRPARRPAPGDGALEHRRVEVDRR